MKRYKYILWDLDGTITASAKGILNAAEYALEKFGITVTEHESLFKFIGPPLWESFERFYEFTKQEAETAVAYFHEYYSEHGLYENEVYEGMESLLKELTEQGCVNILATSKGESFAVKVIDYFGLTNYFALIAGASMDGSRVDKGDVIQYALEQYPLKDISKAVMIGDREHDIIGAKICGMASIGVLYGYGNREELEHAGASEIVSSVEALKERLL